MSINEYKIKSMNLNSYNEETSAVSLISYKIESENFHT